MNLSWGGSVVPNETEVTLSRDQVKSRVDYWRSLAEKSSFDDDMDIVDPTTYQQHLELLADTVAERSEFKRCNGHYRHLDGQPWDQAISRDDCQAIPDWMWSQFRNIDAGITFYPSSLSEPAKAILRSLWKTCLILSRAVANFKELEKYRFSRESFNILLKLTGNDVAEIVNIPISEVEDIQKGTVDCVQAIYRDGQGDLNTPAMRTIVGGLAFTPYKSLLRRLYQPLESVSSPSIIQMLDVMKDTAFLIDLALVSYTGSHGSRFDKDYLNREVAAFEVGLQARSPFSFRCSLTRLACLHNFLDKREVWVFELGSSDRTWESPYTRPLSILTKIKDFADIWGPVYAVPVDKKADKIRQYNVAKGIISRTSRTPSTLRNAIKCHWYSRESWLQGLKMKYLPPSGESYLSPGDLLLISGRVPASSEIMVEKEGCNYTLDMYEEDYGIEFNELGTKHSEWRLDGRGVSFGLSKIVGLSGTLNQKLIPERTLQEKILDKWSSETGDRNPRILNHHLGVEVSHCTGNARRIAVRNILRLGPIALALEERHRGWTETPWGRALWSAAGAIEVPDTVKLWDQFKDHREEMRKLVYFALDLLSTTGLQGSSFNAAFLRGGQESLVDLDVGMNNWALVLKDTPNTASFATVNDICLLCNLPNHSAASCSVSCGPARARTTLHSQLAVERRPPGSRRWDRVFLKKVDETFQKAAGGSPDIVLLRSPGLTPSFLTGDVCVEGLERRDPDSLWGEKIAVYFQASDLSYGGMATARTRPPLTTIEPTMNNVTGQIMTAGTTDASNDRSSALGQMVRPSSLDHQSETALNGHIPERHIPPAYATENDRPIQDDQKREEQVETVLDLRQASPVQRKGGFMRSSMNKLKGNLRRVLD